MTSSSYLDSLFGPPTSPMRQLWEAPRKTSTATPKPTAPKYTAPKSTTPKPTTYDAKNPPPGFTASQWSKLLNMSKTNASLASLIKQYTASPNPNAPAPDAAWRRVNPTDTSQLLRQLSFNVGEMGMPGGYVGAVQLPAYGSGLPPVNNPDMKTYGQTPGYGEATFYQQSMKGGMTPVSALSPMGVPQGWNPGGGTSSLNTKQQLDKYLSGVSSGSGSGSSGGSGYTMGQNLSGGPSIVDLMASLMLYENGGAKAAASMVPKMREWESAGLFGNFGSGGSSSSSSSSASPAPSSPEPFPIFGGTPITPPYGTST